MPKPTLYITSEENADGIINLTWHNAAELRITLKHLYHVVQLSALQYTYFKPTSKCTEDLTNQCKVESILNLDYANYRWLTHYVYLN